MKFTYHAYRELLEQLRVQGYEFTDYTGWSDFTRCVILRHDIDYDINKAVQMAALERDGGVTATYFVLLTSDFYNVFSGKIAGALRQIRSCGHAIGLHFDEMRYPELEGDLDSLRQKILDEAALLSTAVGSKVDVVSMHRPGRAVLDADFTIPGMINSYGRVYFRYFKYLSDSRRRWREPVEEIVASGQFQRLHILTHAFWYHEEEKNIHDTVADFVKKADIFRYECLKENITDLEAIFSLTDSSNGQGGKLC